MIKGSGMFTVSVMLSNRCCHSIFLSRLVPDEFGYKKDVHFCVCPHNFILPKPRKGAKLYPLDAMKAVQAYATEWVKNIKIHIVKANDVFISILGIAKVVPSI